MHFPAQLGRASLKRSAGSGKRSVAPEFPGPIGPGLIEAPSFRPSCKPAALFPGPIGPGLIEAASELPVALSLRNISRPNWAGPH